MSEWLPWLQAASAIVTVLIAISLGPIARLVWVIRKNDLAHMDEKLANMDKKLDANHKAVTAQIEDLKDRVTNVSDRVDQHLVFHASQGGIHNNRP